MYELKGLQITKYDITTSNNVKDILNNTSLDQHKCLKNNCFAVAFYSICYSIISSCSYWNSKTLDAIIQNGSELNNVIKNDYHSKSINMPENVTIFGMTIKVDVSKVSHGKLTSLPENMISLKTLILKNYGKTGFLMCISSYCIACIYQQNTKEKQLFSLLAYEDSISSTIKHIKHISGINKLMEVILNIVQNKQCQTMEYDIQFIHCSSEIPENERKRIIRKRRKKHIYDNLEPSAKKRTAEKKQKRYSKMNPTNKKALCFKLTKKYQSLDNTKKKELLCKLKQNYQCMNAAKKKELLRKAAQKYKTMDISLKKEILSNLKKKERKNNGQRDIHSIMH